MLDEDGFGHHGPGAAGTGEPGDRRQQMQKKDGQIAHRTIVARSRHAQKCSRILEFAMHSSFHGKAAIAIIRRHSKRASWLGNGGTSYAP